MPRRGTSGSRLVSHGWPGWRHTGPAWWNTAPIKVGNSRNPAQQLVTSATVKHAMLLTEMTSLIYCHDRRNLTRGVSYLPDLNLRSASVVSSNRMWLHQLRKGVGLTIVVTLLGLAFGALPARANAVDGLILNLDVNYSGFTTGFYPETGWRVKEGPDGVEVAFPQEWGYTWGGDGRLVAYPRSGWRVKEGPDERAIAYPQESGYTWGGDGRLVAYPRSGWRVKEGPDERAIAYPQESGYTWGGDGRLVAYPRSGWRVKEGPDERAIAYPQEWGYTWGADGRLVAYPYSGWRLAERSNERLIAFPEEWFKWGLIIPSPPSGSLSLMFTSASNQALVTAAEPSLTPDEFRDYVIMQYIQQEITPRG
ncbi:hypothetical protein Strop_4174 [Salinispora tropica CNB-440]|uniref:Uncharacterized protein n=1 Tax=Salinispora tropica (strain ATCC BAA-916 / DSM 44818 / JCM 13857 / NBRC 105044 / CNB-440) TaxID=369723 RepID=A4XCE6_SALTO|nr:hypothetical protein Strop_4174 [Salinispora tropica CNB-440]